MCVSVWKECGQRGDARNISKRPWRDNIPFVPAPRIIPAFFVRATTAQFMFLDIEKFARVYGRTGDVKMIGEKVQRRT